MEEETAAPLMERLDMPSVVFVGRWAVRMHRDTQPVRADEGQVAGWLYGQIVKDQQFRRYMVWHERYTTFLETYGRPLTQEETDGIFDHLNKDAALALWKSGELPGSLSSTPLWRKEAQEDARLQRLMPPSLLRRGWPIPDARPQATVSDSLCFEPQVLYFFHKHPFQTEIKTLPITMEERVTQRHLWRKHGVLPYTDPEGRLYTIKGRITDTKKPAGPDTLTILDAPWKLHESRHGRKHGALDATGYPQQTFQFLRRITTGARLDDHKGPGSAVRERVIMALNILAATAPRYLIAVYLHYVEGYSQKDVAYQLGIQQSAVSQAVKQGISDLLDICQIYGDSDTALVKDLLKSFKHV